MGRLLGALRSQIRYKIILPYLALTLLVMTAGAAIATALVAASWEDRLVNELAQAGRNTTEALAQRERDLLNYLFFVSFAQENKAADAVSIPDAVASHNPQVVSKALRPLYDYGISSLGLDFDRLIVFDDKAQALVDWLHTDSADPTPIEGLDLSAVKVVQDILGGVQVNGNDKFSGMIVFNPDPQPYFYTVVPVKQANKIVGGVLVGIKLDRLLQQIQRSSQAAITTFYDPDGSPLGTTLVRREDELPTLQMPDPALEQLRAGVAQSVYDVPIRNQRYLLGYSPLVIANNQAGFFSVGLSREFQVSSLTINRNAIIGLTLALSICSILVGLWIARMITNPLDQLVTTAESVTAGNLEERSVVQTEDEIGRLGNAFNQMTEQLLHLYRTSRELGSALAVNDVLDITTRTATSFKPQTEVLALLDDHGAWGYALRSQPPAPSERLLDIRLPKDDPLLVESAAMREPRLISPSDEPQLAGTGLKDVMGFQSIMVTPLLLNGASAGALIFGHTEPDAFDGATEPALKSIASMASSVLCNAVLFDRVNQESGEREAILKSIADGVIVCDQQRRIVLMNQTAEKMLGNPDWRTMPYLVDDLPLQRVDVGNAIWNRGDRQMEHFQHGDQVLARSDGPVIGEDGRNLGEVIVLHDISAEAAVDRAKTDFIATISHELRTPLTVINGYTELLLRGMVGELSGEQRELLEQVRARSDHMNNLFKNVIMVASIEADTLRMNVEPQDLWLAIEGAATPMKGAFAKKGIELRNEVSDDLPPVQADREHLLLILTQLLDNARRYTPSGAITINAARNGQFIQVDVHDTGPGIPAEELPKLFTRFHRVEGNSNPERGSGLGLAITRQLIERQGGRIWVDTSVGQGSTFSFTLPLANGHADAVVRPENADTATA